MDQKIREKTKQFDRYRYIEQVANVASDFDRRFQDTVATEPVATDMCFPFGKETNGKETNIEEIAPIMASKFHMDVSEVENELLKLKMTF